MRHIICFGNPLHGDDGYGHAVYLRLAGMSLPEDTRVFDAGTAGINALSLFEHCREAIIVDALAPKGDPGRLHHLKPEELSAESSNPGHASGVAYLLQVMSAMKQKQPRIHILAAEVSVIESFRMELSMPVARAVDHTVVYLVKYFGIQCHD